MDCGSAPQSLRLLQWCELVVGRPVRGDIFDRAGRLLIRKGRRLREEHLRLMSQREHWDVYVDESWSDSDESPSGDVWTPSPEELMHALKRRRRMRGDGGKFRRHPRYECRVRLKVTVRANFKTGAPQREMMVTTCEVSVGGFSFVCKQFVHIGSVLYPRFESIPKRPVMKGIVRNCTHIEGRQHRVGVQFVDPEPGEVLPRD